VFSHCNIIYSANPTMVDFLPTGFEVQISLPMNLDDYF
jgi:hypothetical protein